MRTYTTRVGMGVDAVGDDATLAAIRAISHVKRINVVGEIKYIKPDEVPVRPAPARLRLYTQVPEAIDLSRIHDRFGHFEDIEVLQGGVIETGLGMMTGDDADNIVVVIATLMTHDAVAKTHHGIAMQTRISDEAGSVTVQYTVEEPDDGRTVPDKSSAF